jgi:uncharacterized protein YfiM (DUF2279 family)
MTRSRISLGWLVALALAGPGSVLGTEPSADTVARLGWMAGSWSGTNDGVMTEEHWTSAAGGALVGMHKEVRDGRMVAFEFLRIAPDASGKVCYFGSPGGKPPVSFCAVEIGPRRAVFENLQHDFPQRILYWVDDDGRLHARVEGPLDGKPAAEEWIWRRSE